MSAGYLNPQVAAEGLRGMEVVEVSPPFDVSDITSLLGVRIITETLCSLVHAGKLGSSRSGEPHTERAREIQTRRST